MMRRTGLRAVSARRLAALEAEGHRPFSTFGLGRTELRRDTDRITKHHRDTGPTPTTVALVGERDGWSCASCGRSLLGGVRGVTFSVQHRVARGQGGSRRPELNLPANLLLLCGSGVETGIGPAQCHPRVEQRGTDDLAAGFWLRQWTDGRPTAPGEHAVRHARHGWVWLDDDGSVTPVPERAA
ncbi:MAG TPA: hypothetical protein VHA75_06020 [Rugosimonospora sp.]|nr:hypothetical protein [Rugosimonospora sp.]